MLPLGSVVIVFGAIKKIMIMQRAIQVERDGQLQLFDYGAVPYPEGLLDDQLLYFNQKNIDQVVFEGFKDRDETIYLDQIEEAKKALLADLAKDDQQEKTDKPASEEVSKDPFEAVKEAEKNE
ncbi:DUF4176 domain-containing protein [Lacticaseibacillus paracasei]|uniref:DUF4176 domain-containing protein n=1 Tax=Lacticaseibacillus paracasei TaxID=1597 RepID=UPI0006ACA9F5|nr:DUF4176 domain-containing protein [Lacticaseibacillus paracasei]